MKALKWALTGFATWALTTSAMAVEMEGYTVDESCVVAGKTLHMLGTPAVRKRGYFKVDVTSLYLPAPRHSLADIDKLPGPKRLQLIILRDLTGSTLNHYFLSDFKLAATDAEFKSLITEVGQTGAYYAQVGTIKQGTVVDFDWLPEEHGFTVLINGKPLGPPMKSELMYQIFLRMYVGKPDYLRESILGN